MFLFLNVCEWRFYIRRFLQLKKFNNFICVLFALTEFVEFVSSAGGKFINRLNVYGIFYIRGKWVKAKKYWTLRKNTHSCAEYEIHARYALCCSHYGLRIIYHNYTLICCNRFHIIKQWCQSLHLRINIYEYEHLLIIWISEACA